MKQQLTKISSDLAESKLMILGVIVTWIGFHLTTWGLEPSVEFTKVLYLGLFLILIGFVTSPLTQHNSKSVEVKEN